MNFGNAQVQGDYEGNGSEHRNFMDFLNVGKCPFGGEASEASARSRNGIFATLLKRGSKITSFRFRGGLNPPRSWAVDHEGQRTLLASLFIQMSLCSVG